MTATTTAVSWKRIPGSSTSVCRSNTRRSRKLGAKSRQTNCSNIFRWYRAGWGRYTQADPIGLRTSLNLYSFASENPNTFLDSTGLACSSACPDCPSGKWVVYGGSLGGMVQIGSMGWGGSSGYFETYCPSSGMRCGFTYTCGSLFGKGLYVGGGGLFGVAVNAPCADDIAGVSFGAQGQGYAAPYSLAGAAGSASVSPSGATQLLVSPGFGAGAGGSLQLCGATKRFCRR